MAKKIGTKIIISAASGVVEFKIIDYVGWTEETSSQHITEKVDEYLKQGFTECSVYLNTRGGDTFEATEIVNQLNKFKKVSIEIGAVAASAATFLTSSFHSSARRSTQLMIHQPSLGVVTTLAQLPNHVKALETVTSQYREAYMKKTGMTAEEVDAFWGNGDVWMTAEEALEKGFIDAIIEEEIEVDDNDIALLTACGATHIPTIKKQTSKNSSEMDKLQLRASLGLAADATDAEVTAALDNAKKANQEAAQLKEQLKAEKEAKVDALITAALAAKQITAEQEAPMRILAMSDYDAAKKMIEAQAKVPQLSKELDVNAAGAGAKEDRSKWTLEDYMEKDPTALDLMASAEPDKLKKLNEAYFG